MVLTGGGGFIFRTRKHQRIYKLTQLLNQKHRKNTDLNTQGLKMLHCSETMVTKIVKNKRLRLIYCDF